MSWPMWLFRWSMALLLVAGSGFAVARHVGDTAGGRYGKPEILKPKGAPRAMVVMFPDVAAPARARATAQQLVSKGALVAMIDTSHYLHSVGESTPVDCSRLADDAERLAKHLLHGTNAGTFQPPLLVGDGTGALLVRQAMASAPPDLLGGAVVVGQAPSGYQLACASGAPSQEQGTLTALSNTTSANQLTQAVTARFPSLVGLGVAALPLVEMPVPGSHRLAIMISGDGGWRELDKGIAAELNRQGVSVIGWNSLRYFWSRHSPQQIADDLARVIDTYQHRWQINDVALVGYSFGADVMPFAYQRLPQAQRDQVRLVTLLGLAHGADFKVQIRGWLGLAEDAQVPVLPELIKMPPSLLQCINGEEEKDTLCPELATRGVEVFTRPGGHHFDHNPVKLATIVLQGWQRRTSAMHA